MSKIIRLQKFKKIRELKNKDAQRFRLLRSNELYRLKSIQNKKVRKIPLDEADKRDFEEIMAIEAGQVTPANPEENFYQPAFTRNMGGTVYWYQRMKDGPLRELTKEERASWDRLGPVSFFGYIRSDGSIQAYHLSGCQLS